MKKWMKSWGRRLAVLAAAVFSFSLHAAPGGTLKDVDHPNTYPTPQNVMASYGESSKVTVSWDGVRWPADGYPEEIDGKEVPTNFYYEVDCRKKESGATTWGDWWNLSSANRFDYKTGAFLPRVTYEDPFSGGAGTNYQYRIRCVQYVSPENPIDLPEDQRIRDVYRGEWSETVTASKTLDKLTLTLVENANENPLRGGPGIEINYVYDSSRAAEGEEPLYFTYKAIEIPDPAPGTTPEAPAVGGKPYARRDGTPLPVKSLYVRPPNIALKPVDPTNFTLTPSSDIEEGDLREMTWHADGDLANYYHTNVTIWVQGWAKPETEGGKPRLVLDEAIGDLTIDTRKLTAGPNPEQDGVLLTWPSDSRVVKYEVWRKPDGGTAYLLDTVTGTSYTDMFASAGEVYHYEVKAFDSDGKEIDSAYASGYSRLDAFSTRDKSLYFVQPQTPWNGKVDIVVRYHSARDPWGEDGIPIFKLIAEDYVSGATQTVKTLTRVADGQALNPDGFVLADEQELDQRFVWDAGADLGETLIERLRLTVDCVRVEPYDEGDPVKAWTGSPAKYKENIRLDTRNPRIRKLGQGTEAYVDLDWFPGATKADLYCNGTLIHTITDEGTRCKTLDKELNIWGTNELKVVTDTGVTWTGGIAYPAFGFTVEGNEDGITLTWNTVDDEAVGGYQIRRRVKGSTDDFVAVATVGADVTTYTDTTADEVGAYEYTVVPRRTWDADIGPVPAAQRGYRSLDKIEIVRARQLYPWTTQVALDVAYTSGRDEATDGAVTYRLEAALADGTKIPIGDKSLRLEDAVTGFNLIPKDIPFGSKSLPSGKTTRLWWNAPADLGAVQVPSDVVSDIVLRLVPTLADDAPEGAVAAPAPSEKNDLTVDLRTVRPVTVGEKIPIVWEWMRTDTRVETKDRTEISFELQNGEEKFVILKPEQMTGEGEIEVTDEMWTGFRLIKREKNDDDTDDANVIKLTSEVLFQLPVKPITNVQATRGNADALTVTWDAVPNVAHYQLDITTYGERGKPTTQTQEVSGGTQYVDTTAPAVGLVRYTVTAVYANGMKGATSDPVVGWRMLDAVDWKGVSTRWPWNGMVDIDFAYQTGRRHYAMATGAAEDLPERIVTVAVKTAQGVDLQVQTLRLETLDEDAGILGRQKVTNGAFTLGSADRIIWDAPADAPVGMYEPGATLTVTLKGDAYSGPIVFEKTFDLDTRIEDIELPFGAEDVQIPWSTRWANPEAAVLGSGDNWWKQTAVLTDITDSANPVEILRTEAKLGEGTTNSWTPKDWRNTITLRLSPYAGENEMTEYAAVFKLPDFDFTATTDDEDGVTLTWDDLDGAASYEIRRRKAGETDFVTVTNMTDATTWTDDSVDTVVGDFEYVVVPISKTGTTLPLLPAKPGTRGAPQQVQNVTASTNDSSAVTVTWDAVPHAAYYEIKVERWNVAINCAREVARADSNRFIDDQLPQPGLGRYTVTAVYANGMKGAASEAVVGYAVLDTMKILGVSTRWPWNGKVDLDVEYKTMRPRFRELFGRDDLPYPTNVTLAAQTADGKVLTVSTLVKEPAVDGNYTVNRKAVENGTAIFSGSGWQRLVWDADADTQNSLLATNATLTLTVTDDYSSLTDSCTVDIDTTKPMAIPLADEETEVTLPWAARWADEDSTSLNMQDGTDLQLVEITKYDTVTNVVDTMTMLSDECGAFTNSVGYGITVFENTFSNRATTASQTYRCMFFRAPVIPVTVTRMPGMNALDIRWTGAGDCIIYQIVRRTVYADGTRSDWQNRAPVSLYGENDPGPAGTGRYIDIGVVGGTTYEYAACPMYNDPDKRVEYITAEPVVWTAGSVAINVVLDALGRYFEDGSTIVTQFVGDVYGTLPTATRTGYTLVGWTLGVTNGAPKAVEGGSLLVPANHTLYAKWAVDPVVSPDVDADGNSVFDWEPDGQTARILGFRDPALRVTNLVLPDTLDGHPVTEIADYAFANSTSGLTALTLPAYCTRIGKRAFSGVKTLTRLTFTPVRDWASPSDAGGLVIGRYAFAATGLTEVFLPVEVVQIGDYAFADCRKLTDVKVLGRPAVGERPFRRAGIDAGVKPTIHLNKDLENDADYLDRITQDFGNDVFEVRTDAVVTGLSLGALAVPAPGTVFLSVDVERASAWGEVDVSRLRVAYRASLGDAPTDLVPRAVTHEADGSLTVEVDAPEGPSGFFRVKLVK